MKTRRRARTRRAVAAVFVGLLSSVVPASPAAAEPTGVPVFTSQPPAVLDATLGGRVELWWIAEAPGDPSQMSMTLKKSTDGGLSWTNTGGCGASSETRLQCGTFFDAELADSGTRWRATVRNAAGTRTSTPTTITVCEGPLPCDRTVVATPGGALTLEGDDGTTTVDVPLTLSRSSTRTVTVQWTTIFDPSWSELAARPGTDYVAESGLLTFAPGETEKTASVTVVGDLVPESDELLVVSFHDPTNARIGGFWGLGLGAITDDD